MEKTRGKILLKKKKIWNLCETIRKEKILVHCITNVITVNDCANVLLALGASPTMAHHPKEVGEITKNCHALVCNMGAMESYRAMEIAVRKASYEDHPIVLDPVGTAGSIYRRKQCMRLIKKGKISCIRGNYSEIQSLLYGKNIITGVDAEDGTFNKKQFIQEEVKQLAQKLHCVIVASGKIDIVSDGERSVEISNGHEMMTKVTGCGCMQTAMIGAFLGASRKENQKPDLQNTLLAAACACIVLGISGEKAAEKTHQLKEGTLSFRTHLIDAVSLFSLSDLN